ncbi:MAG TPA: hypothetical protein VLL52_25965 [Anaerolineae bacterium]|nr:hypothetical protein [Anaerolineae bacterium]
MPRHYGLGAQCRVITGGWCRERGDGEGGGGGRGIAYGVRGW